MKLESNLGILDRINVAHCAAERARMYVCDTERFNGEKLLTAFPDLVEKYGPTSKFTRTLQEVI
jgi:hypothetical protein